MGSKVLAVRPGELCHRIGHHFLVGFVECLLIEVQPILNDHAVPRSLGFVMMCLRYATVHTKLR